MENARLDIIHGEIEAASKQVYDLISILTSDQQKVFEQNDIELLPAYFLLAEANICLGGARLKKAEEFLIAAYWNLLNLKSQDDKDGDKKTIVSEKEIQAFTGTLHKTFGRLFLSQQGDPTYKKALDELTKGIFIECQQHGPESFRMCSSYFYMGEVFRKQEEGYKQPARQGKDDNHHQNARAYYCMIAAIWRKFILKNDF